MTTAFGVGSAKSGTHSLAAMLKVPTAHEADAGALLRLVLDHHAGRLSQDDFAGLIGQRFARLDLQVNVSQINGAIIDTLLELYPHARFVLTLRDCASWLLSFVNHQLTRPLPAGSAWHGFRDLRFQPADFPHRPQDQTFAAQGLYSLDAYLAYWVRHNAKVVQTVPAGQLLTIITPRLSHDAGELARFLGLEPDQVDQAAGHAFRGDYSASPLDRLDPAYLADRLQAHNEAFIDAAGGRLSSATVAYLSASVA